MRRLNSARPSPAARAWALSFPARAILNMSASGFDTAALTQAAREAGFNLPDGWRPIPERIPSTLSDSNQSTRQTVRRMCQHIKDACADQLVRDIAARTSGRWGSGLPHQIGWDVFWFLKSTIRFVIDEVPVLALYGESDQVDFLISPSVLMRMRPPKGDCDDFTMMACALLACNRVPFEIVTIMADRSRPGQWSHIYPRAVMPSGRRMVIDATPPGQYPGWEVPAYDIQRKQIWDANGNPIADSAPAQDQRMHAYRPRRRRGMGQTEISDQPLSYDPTGTFGGDVPPAGVFMDPSRADYNPFGSGSGSGFNWNSLFSNLSAVGTKLGTLALLPTGGTMTTLPNGTQVFTNQATAPAGGFSFGSGAPIGMGTIMLIGIGLVALIAVSESGGHR